MSRSALFVLVVFSGALLAEGTRGIDSHHLILPQHQQSKPHHKQHRAVSEPATDAQSSNMNGLYMVATGDKQGVEYNTDYKSRNMQYFDVYTPELATHYGEVFWTGMGKNKLPDDIIQKFQGKTIAITGYEMDQVMVTPTGHPGVNSSKDVSVPITWAYNHHYMLWMTGSYSYMEEVQNPDPNDVSAHGAPMKWQPVETPEAALRADLSIPTSQLFSEGNGGESRKSYHGYPSGYAQLIESPNEWHITPMQIDTRNRDCGVTPADIHNCTNGYHPGPEPKQARMGFKVPTSGTNYSGLLECPCNGRFGGDPAFYTDKTKTKIIEHRFSALGNETCSVQHRVSTPQACFDAAASVGVDVRHVSNMSVTDKSIPEGCTMAANSNGTTTVYFNQAHSTVHCSTAASRLGVTALSEVGVTVNVSLAGLTEHTPHSGKATITLSGPSDVWFAVGFNATVMADSPYALVVNASEVFEQHIGTCGSEAEHCAGTRLIKSIELISNNVEDGVRTVVITRAFKGLTKHHYSFDADLATIPLISAVGSSQVFAYHAAHTTGVISMLGAPSGAPTCLCDMGSEGKLCITNGTKCVTFKKFCSSSGSLIDQKNPTCNSRQYSGGVRGCGHKRILLDADQPIRPELLKYHMKFRFWYQEYTPAHGIFHRTEASHQNLDRIYYQTESFAGEYDVPPAFARDGLPIPGYPNWPANTPTPGTTCTGTCPDGPDCECIHTITYHWKMLFHAKLIYAGGHCHAPACISMELYRNDTGHEMELMCRQEPVFGQGNVTHNKFDEAGYILIPPCLWGDEGGLNPAVELPFDTPMVSIKKNRNTYHGHYGEMASWQMRGTHALF
mmetsp:Transcript_19469/g.23306  ORF Transcript_19469/g.23306 Transcript_19469/m.23306 type:complete len:842 (-) Transcript_19469:99-2624(-)